ncbi:DUF5985 family protein [Thermomonas sp.]|uniref:DUF5985 family protein n=1 Tax=Thermomonas sp. TaxID=1971895 RepID=UPI00248922A1|nr:DUF5985 family protein [Thermomonas sp.]MDI1252149.1 DUF5985 family protein [Thermomonas sp.]
MSDVASVLTGSVAMASFVAMMFFLRFWRQTRDEIFMLFGAAFGIDAAMRFALGFNQASAEVEPLFYLGRPFMFGLIIFAIIRKNRIGRRDS